MAEIFTDCWQGYKMPTEKKPGSSIQNLSSYSPLGKPWQNSAKKTQNSA
jgi:hypothetical protein